MSIVSMVVFLLIRMVPGDIVDAMVNQQVVGGVSFEVDREAIRKRLGLDVPMHVQYGRWLGIFPNREGRVSGILQGDFGYSLWRGTPIVREVALRWPVTLELGLIAFLLAQLVSLPVGIYSALRAGSWGDYIARTLAIMAIAVPGFWLGTMVIVFPSIWWGYMPPLILVRFAEDPVTNLKMFLAPAIILGMVMSGDTVRMSRTMMLEVLRQDYIRTAWAKGLRERVVVARHAVRNALIPVVTMIGYDLPVMIGGSVITEQIFNLPGMGRLFIDAVQNRDYTVVSALMLLFGFALVLINLVVDVTYALLDRRIEYR